MDFMNLINGHDEYRSKCINLVASENRLSPLASLALSSDMGHRYFFKKIFETETGLKYDYCGAKYIREMYEATEDVAKKLFGAEYVNLEMLSGHLANLNILFSYCKPGDTIICSDTLYGGYPGLGVDKLPKYLGLNVKFLPQTQIAGDVDLIALERLIVESSPKIVMLSSSITLFPFPVREVSSLCHKYNVPFCYDASHPLGLIAGGEFQDPFGEGADLIIGSTHKSFPGPQGGIILGQGQFANVEDATDFVVVDNIHPNRIAALGVTLYEAEEFGQAYAKQVVKNAKALSQALIDRGFSVAFQDKGCTESHQFLLIKDFGSYSEFASNMEKIGIILDNSGRIGVGEITRLGMTESEMATIANFFELVVSHGVASSIENDVTSFMSEFSAAKYCFDVAKYS